MENLDLYNFGKRVIDFVNKYAVKNPNYEDDSDNVYTSPDASMMLYSGELLMNNIIPQVPFSEWSSGGYRPYTSVEGFDEHLYIIKKIKELNDGK